MSERDLYILFGLEKPSDPKACAPTTPAALRPARGRSRSGDARLLADELERSLADVTLLYLTTQHVYWRAVQAREAEVEALTTSQSLMLVAIVGEFRAWIDAVGRTGPKTLSAIRQHASLDGKRASGSVIGMLPYLLGDYKAAAERLSRAAAVLRDLGASRTAAEIAKRAEQLDAAAGDLLALLSNRSPTQH